MMDLYHQHGEDIRARILDPNEVGTLMGTENSWIYHQGTWCARPDL
jgi:hypothetical protein